MARNFVQSIEHQSTQPTNLVAFFDDTQKTIDLKAGASQDVILMNSGKFTYKQPMANESVDQLDLGDELGVTDF